MTVCARARGLGVGPWLPSELARACGASRRDPMRSIVIVFAVAVGASARLVGHAPLPPLALRPEARPPIARCASLACRAASNETALSSGLSREVAAIALPAVAGALIDPFLSLIDTLWVGRIADRPFALGATAASSELFTMAFAGSLALRESSSSSIARLSAAGRGKEAAAFGFRTLQIGLASGALLCVLIASPATAPSAVALMGAHRGSPLFVDALAYARVRAIGLPLALASSAAEGAFRGLGDTRTPFRAAAIAALVNAAFDPLFIFAPLGLGVAGAAAATVLAQAVSLLTLLLTLVPRLRQLQRDDPIRAEQQIDVQLQQGVAAADGEDEAAGRSTSARGVAGTTAATLIRSTSVLGCWVFIASFVSRVLGPQAIASHGVVLKVWLLLVLAAEAPAVAAQVLCTRRLATGQMAEGRALLMRMIKLAVLLGALGGLTLLCISAPAAAFFFGAGAAADPATAQVTVRLFRWAALNTILVGPTITCEATLLGAGRSYRYLAGATMANAIAVSTLTHFALRRTRSPAAAWQCILLFFVLRLSAAVSRIFMTNRSGFGSWRSDSDSDGRDVRTQSSS